MTRLMLTICVAALVVATTHAAEPPQDAPKPFDAPPGKFVKLFDGRALGGWKVTPFGGEGEVEVKDGELHLGIGSDMTGVTWTKSYPKINYEISLDAKRTDGGDFFCGLTFPVGDKPCSFIVGGWGGGTVGLSSIDDADASENETTTFHSFDDDRWYKIRVRVTEKKIQAWIDQERVVNLDTHDRRISIRSEVELNVPLGLATWSTAAAYRNIEIRRLTPVEIAADGSK